LGTFDVLKRCEIFLGLHDGELKEIVDLSSCQERMYQPQEVVFKAGEKAEHLYVIEEGQVDLIVKVSAASPQLAEQMLVCTIGKGGVFGWPALVPPHIFTLTAISKGPFKAVVIGGEEVRALFREHPSIGYEVTQSLLRVIASRFRTIEGLLITGKRSMLLEIARWTDD
jgi:CRP-like cAMP-binding protein